MRRLATIPSLIVLAGLIVSMSSLRVGAADGKENAQERAIRMYCTSMRDKAVDARFVWQHRALKELDRDVAARVEELKKRTEEYRKWYRLRHEFAERATDMLVKVYSGMRPDAAAAQLSAMQEMTAAALVLKLETRVASAILNEMAAAKAARLSSIIADSARKGRAGGGS